MPETRTGHVSASPSVASPAYGGAIRPELFAGRAEARLAKPLGLTQFGVNQVRLLPGAATALRHWHEAEDEFVYVLEGVATLVDDNGEHELEAGGYAAFAAGVANGHHFVNRSAAPVALLVIGSRRPGEDVVHYPDDAIGPFRRPFESGGA
jgi:uncharacterized cupin superfamily protein